MPRRKQQAPRRASAYIDDDEFAEDCAHEEESGEASEDDPRVPSPSQGLEQQQEQQEHEPLALRALTQTRDNRCGNVDSNGNHHLVQGSDDEGDNNNDVDDDDDGGGGGGGDDDEGMNNHSHNHNHHHHHHHRSRSSNSSSSNKTKNGISSQMNNSGSSNNANGGNGNDIDDDDDDDDDGGGEMEEEAEEEEEEMVDDDGDVDDDRGVALEKEATAAAAADSGVGAPPAKSAPHFCLGSSSNGQTDSDKAGRRRVAKQEEEAAATTPTNADEEEEEDKKKDPVSPSVIEDSLSQMKAAYANFLSSSYWSTVGSFSYAQPNGAGGGGGGGGAGANFDWHRAAVAKSLQQATSPSTPSPLYAHDQQCGLFSSVQLYRQSSKLYSPVFTGASKFRCRDCSAAYDRLVDLTVHMSETGHYRDESMRAANGGADGSGNRQAWSKPRKRSLMEIEGKEEAQKVLRCLCCGHAFESLQDLSVHMIRTKHYQKVPLREPMAALTAKPCHATKKRPHLETTAVAAAVVAAGAERACSSPESTVSDAATTPPADQLSGNHKGQVVGSNCPARSSSTTANTTTSSSHHHHHHHQNGTSYSWQFESQKAHILKCMECGSSHDTLQQLTAHMMATGHFIKLTAPANSSSSSSLLLARKSKQVNFEAHAADDKVQSVHLGATSKLGAVPPPAVAAVKVERQSARDGDRHAGAEGKKANVKDKKSEQREKRETSAAAEKGVTAPSPDLPKHQEADLPSQFDYLKEEDLSESSKEGGLDILKSLEHTVASIISKAQNGSGSWGGYPSIHAAYQLPGHVARPAHAPSVAPSKLVTRDDLELQQQQRQQHRHHHHRQQPSPPPSRSHVESSSSSSPSSSAATTPSPPASPHGAKVPPLVPSPPVQPLPSNVRAMEELVRKMTEKVNSSSATSSSSSPFSAASSSRMTRDASESKGAPPRTAAAIAGGKREARDDKGHAAARGAELFGGRDVKWDLGQELRRKANHEARRGAGARDARDRHGREAQRLGGGGSGGSGERLRDVKVERTIEVKSEATRGASPPAGVEASAVCLKVEGAQGAGRRDGSCTAAATEVAVAATGGANKTCEARNGKSTHEKPFSSSSSSSSSCTPPGFSSLSIITEHPGEPCLVNPLSALQSVMNAHLGKAAKPLSPALLDPLSRLHRLGGSSLDRPRSAAATALPASLGHARHADGAAGGDERAPAFAARGEPSSDQPMDLTKSKPASAAAERCRAGGSVTAMPLMLAASPAGENALSDISDLVRNLAGRLTPKPPTPSSATSSVAASDRSDGGDACSGGAPDEDAAEAERGPPGGGAGGGSAASADVSGKQRKAGRQSAWNPRHLLLLQAQFAASLRQTADGRYVISDLSPQERLNVARATGLSASTISHWLANVKYQLRRTGGTKFLKHMDTGRPVFYCCDCAMQFRTPPAYVGHAEAHLGFGLRDLSKVAVVERTGAEGLAVGSQQAASPSPPPPSVAAAAAAVVAVAATAAAAGPRDEPECGAPCRCQLCGRSFSSRHAVKLHLSKAHSKSPEDHVMFVSDVAADQPAPQPQA
ncbi:teashirt homolog 3-like [Lethenteron reissneri]|uniref:teashirt homolog 3-like n=1 Tax=Lethenteron reissneri TaxID=7753 RepID=UPI002AB5FDF7|nr:teashirt homolog 3-like [Lethenteron reissneri]XP_061421771.1 teashirt homolog 3-like [Lethenteron reissneri]